MKERFSNVLAWLGFLYPALFWFMVLISFTRFEVFATLAKFFEDNFVPDDNYPLLLFLAFGLYPCCAIVNYLLVGRFRLLPWVEK
jgi:hypothetical protein